MDINKFIDSIGKFKGGTMLKDGTLVDQPEMTDEQDREFKSALKELLADAEWYSVPPDNSNN